MIIRFVAIETRTVEAYRHGGPDANGQSPERHIATVDGLPCRHCLAMICRGEHYLVLAHRPFAVLKPYAEVGPIFLHAAACERGGGDGMLPKFLDSPRYIVRGYDLSDRIVYGSGAIVETIEIPQFAHQLLADEGIAYAHIRSATNSCYHCRIERA